VSDFLLDLREPSRRDPDAAAARLRFYPDMSVHRLDRPSFSLVVTRADEPATWGPCEMQGGGLVALGGRLAFDEAAWKAAAGVAGEGGLACKAVARSYTEQGERALERLNGNFLVVLHDERERALILATDRCGMYPCFRHAAEPVYASHPDVLAAATGEASRWDMTSLAEFAMCGRVSNPCTYYERIAAVPSGSLLRFDLASGRAAPPSERRYFRFAFSPETSAPAGRLAADLGRAFQAAIGRRTLPSLGRAAFALSGGLDSRVIASLAGNKAESVAFCSVESENREHAIARDIAARAGIEFFTLRRPPDFYGENAEMGVRISGGMGSLANNHFLGFRGWLRDRGVRSLLTGCYCDYLFKGLVLDKTTGRITKRQALAPFRDQHYFTYFPLASPHAARVAERQGGLFPPELRRDTSIRAKLEIERLRTFPLFYEGDNMQRVVPQRVMPWYLPIVDNDLLDVYLRLPPAVKLNRRVFSLMVRRQCPPGVAGVPDANTETRVGAGPVEVAARRLQRFLATRLTPGAAGAAAGCWPDWATYVPSSPALRRLWEREPASSREVLRELAGDRVFRARVDDYRGGDVYLLVRLLTLKVWLDQRQG
jgi:asparagine synthase (glutamine-hydrolysing)